MALSPTTRFTDRVDNYVRHRPGYPPRLISALAARAQLSSDSSIVADIGSGIGILTEPLLALAARVYAVEPNAAMRAAAERAFRANPRFVSVGATAEATTLPAQSIDLIAAGQAFHWFDHTAARHEFARILKPGGAVALVWNERQTAGSPFLEAYEAILRQLAPDYVHSRHTLVNESSIAAFFAPARHQVIEFPTAQSLDLGALIGRALSSSYAPNPGHPDHEAFVAALKNLFAQTAQDGRVEMRYLAKLHLGQLG